MTGYNPSMQMVYLSCLNLLALQFVALSRESLALETHEEKDYGEKQAWSSDALPMPIHERDQYDSSKENMGEQTITDYDNFEDSFSKVKSQDCNPHAQLRRPSYTGTQIGGGHSRKLTCQPKGRRINHPNCPLLETKSQLYALCSFSNITDITRLNLPLNITVLCLDNNKIKTVGPGVFEKYPKLRFLELSDNAYLKNISVDAFKGLKILSKLLLSNTTVTHIENETFVPLRRMVSLSLAFWAPRVRTPEELDLPCLQGLVHTKVQHLDLSGINKLSAEGQFWDLKPPTFSVLRHLRLRKLWLKHNQIIAIREGVFSNFKYLMELWLSHNLLLGGDSGVVLRDLPSMRNLNYLDMGYQNYVFLHWWEDPKWASYFPPKHKGRLNPASFDDQTNVEQISNFEDRRVWKDSCLVLPPKLTNICLGHSNIVKDINIDNLRICSNNSVWAIHANNIFMRHVYRGVMESLPNLKFLDLHGSKMVVRNLQFMQSLKNLETLNLNYFSVDRILNSPDDWKNFTKYTKFSKLRKLNMANNYLDSIPRTFFLNFPSLEKVNISHNYLQDVPIWLQNFSHLTYVDLSFNRFKNISVTTISDWLNASRTYNHTVTIDLSNNSIICTCNDDKMVEIAQIPNTTLKLIGFVCHFFPSGETLNVVDVQLLAMRGRRCRRITYTYAFYFTYGIMLICSLVLSISFRYRHYLQYSWYFIKYMKNRHLVRMHSRHMITHDVFFCCATDDLKKMENFYNTMEKVHQYRLFIIERDGLGCKTEADGIKDAFSCSNSIVLVVSQKAARGRYFKYITHLARERSDRRGSQVVCLFLEKRHLLPEWLVPDALEYLMCTSLCLPWNPKVAKDPAFWMRLRETLGPPMDQLALKIM